MIKVGQKWGLRNNPKEKHLIILKIDKEKNYFDFNFYDNEVFRQKYTKFRLSWLKRHYILCNSDTIKERLGVK